MGVVKREGDWRLEKRGEGIYEITFQKETRLRVYTKDASQRQQQGFEMRQTRRVSSYHDVEEIFEEKARGPAPMGMGQTAGEVGANQEPISGGGGEGVDLEEVPPAGIAFVLIFAGLFSLSMYSQAGTTILLLAGLLMGAAGAGIFGYGIYLFSEYGWPDAREFLFTTSKDGDEEATTADEDDDLIKEI